MPPRKAVATSEPDAEQSGVRPFWSGTLTFGLVSVPVNLFPATQSARSSLRMLGPSGEPLSRRYFSEKTERDLQADQMVRGFETDKGKYVVVTDEELDRLAPEKSRDIDLKLFVDSGSIPPAHFERGYFLTPAANSEKAYKLLEQSMEKNNLIGIATFVMRGKEYLVAIIPDHGLLRAETMRFADEIRSPNEVGLPKKPKISDATVKKFERLISGKSKKQLSTKNLEDTQTDRLLKLVKKKSAQKKNVVEVEGDDREKGAEVIDLVSILKKSLAGKGK